MKEVFETTPGVVDVDWSVEAPQRRSSTFRVDRVLRRARRARAWSRSRRRCDLALSGAPAGIAPAPETRERRCAIVPRLPLADRSSVEALLSLPVATATRAAAAGPLRAAWRPATRESVRMRKNLRPVIYVTGDVAGTIESPGLRHPGDEPQAGRSSAWTGRASAATTRCSPTRLDETAIKWDGEWQVTIEVFRDLGLAFAVVLLLIYVLVVGWFQSFKMPLVIMAPIPLTLIGILPGHALTGAFFTATSHDRDDRAGGDHRAQLHPAGGLHPAGARRAGRTLREAVIEAGAVRFRPIALTAAAVVVGGLVMVLDPIFQGLAVALISGAVVATLLTMVVVPLLYWELQRRDRENVEASAMKLLLIIYSGADSAAGAVAA